MDQETRKAIQEAVEAFKDVVGVDEDISTKATESWLKYQRARDAARGLRKLLDEPDAEDMLCPTCGQGTLVRSCTLCFAEHDL